MRSNFRRRSYNGLNADEKARGVFAAHVSHTHHTRVNIEREHTMKQLFEHAKIADPSKLPASAKIAEKVANEARIHSIYIAHGERMHIPSGLEALSKAGHSVLYRWSAAGPGTPIPNPTNYASHFVINPIERTTSYYGGFLKDRQITDLFQREKGDIHDAYWELVDETEKQTGKHVYATSIDFEPETGKIMHIRERTLRNVIEGSDNRALYSVDVESSMPLVEDRISGRTPSINHTVTVRNRIGKFDKRYPYAD